MFAPDLVTELAHALAIAGALFAIIEFRPGRSGLMLLAMALVFCVYFGNPLHRVYSFHGFWHHSIVYEILNGRFPPQDPLAAGERLYYPWGMHLAAAGLSSLLRITPPLSFALMNVTCLFATILVLFRIVRTLGLDPQASMLGVAVALFGITPLNFGAFATLVQPAVPVAMDFRGTPVFAQFTAVNGASFGLLFYALALYSLLRIFAEARTTSLTGYLTLLVAIAGSAFFYPLMALGILAASAAAIGGMALCGADRRQLLGTPGALLAGMILVLPYLLSIAGRRDATAAFGIEGSWLILAEDAVRYGLTTLVLVAMILWQRDAFLGFWRRRRNAAVVLGGAAAITGLLYVVGSYPHHGEYKLLMLSTMTLAILVAPALGSLYDREPMICFAVVASLFLPLAADLSLKLDRKWWQITDPYVENGTQLEAAVPAERQLYEWIRANTTIDDAFIDTWLTIPVFAQRPLFLGVNWRMPHRVPNGWFVDPRVVLRDIEGRPLELIDAREALVRGLILDVDPPADRAFSAVHDGSFRGDLYVVTRSPRQSAKLDADSRFDPVFASGRAGVYRLAPSAKDGDSGSPQHGSPDSAASPKDR